MKKIVFATLAACMCVCLSAGLFAACDSGNTGGGGGDPAEYDITAGSGTGYSVDAPSSAEEGATVTVTVTVTDEDTYITEVTYNGNDCDGEDGKYTFTMPAEDVTLAVQTGTYEEVLSDGMATFSAENLTRTIAVNASNTAWEDNIWTFYINTSSSQTYALSSRSKTVSSDQSVIPDSAITVEGRSATASSGLLYSSEVKIDTSKISAGSAWLEMYFKSNNTSAEGTLMIKITVVPYGEVPVTTAQKTLVIDVSALNAAEGDYYTMRFFDNNYIDGGTAKEFFDVTAQVAADDTVSFTFDYALLHKYNIAMCPGREYDYQQTESIKDSTEGTATDSLYNGKTSDGLMFWTADTIELEASA